MKKSLILIASLFLHCAPFNSNAALYEVGPTKELKQVREVPWESLEAGDEVRIHWRNEPYRTKWVICRRGTKENPITVRGVPGPAGKLPVISGKDAVMRRQLNYPNEGRSIVKIGEANRPPDLTPAHIVIEGLEIRSGRPGFYFTGRSGRAEYTKNCAAIHISKGENITIRGCVLHDSGNGLMSSAITKNILIERNWIHSNGIENSVYEHNTYTSSGGITYQFNHFGPLRPGCGGSNLKDRSAGLIVRHNWIEGGNRQLDLVDAEDSAHLRDDPRYKQTHVYGNILVEPDGARNNQVVHFGGDSGKEEWYRNGVLYFYNNTVVSTRRDRTTLFRLSSDGQRIDARNNIFWGSARGRHLAISASDAGTINLMGNWFKTGILFTLKSPSPKRIANGNLLGPAPGFVNAEGKDFRLQANSRCRCSGGPLNGSLTKTLIPREQYEFRANHAPLRLKPGCTLIGALNALPK